MHFNSSKRTSNAACRLRNMCDAHCPRAQWCTPLQPLPPIPECNTALQAHRVHASPFVRQPVAACARSKAPLTND